MKGGKVENREGAAGRGQGERELEAQRHRNAKNYEVALASNGKQAK